MSDSPVNARPVGPPPPRRQVAPAQAGLFSRDRVRDAAEAEAAFTHTPDERTQVVTAPTAAEPEAIASSQSYKMTFSLPEDLRNRLRSVYRATRTPEDDESLSAMLAGLIQRECLRREAIYNGGERYSGGGDKLRQGRPLH